MGLPDNFEAEIDSAIDATIQEATPELTESEPTEPSDDLPNEIDAEPEPQADVEKIKEGGKVVDGDAEPEVGVEPTEPGGGDSDTEGGEPTEPAASVISDEAMAMAYRVGISTEDARRFSSDGALSRVVSLIADAELQRRATEQPAPESPADPLAAIPDLDPEDYDAKTVEMFSAMKGVLQKQQETIDSFRESQDAAIASSQAATNRETTQWFDSEIKSLGNDFDEILGQGNIGDLVPGSSQLAKRNEIASQCAVLYAGYQASGQRMPPREDIFRASARLVLQDEYQSLHEKGMAADVKKRAGQHIHRVTGTKTKATLSPIEEIGAEIDAKFGS